MKISIVYVDGYIEKREVLMDGSLPRGVLDFGKPRKVMYFAQLENPGYWHGPLRDMRDEAFKDGQQRCEKVGVYSLFRPTPRRTVV